MENAPSHINALEEFKFKLLCQLQIFPSGTGPNCKSPVRLVATSSKYGLIFIGDNQGFQCIQTDSIISLQNKRANNRGKITSYPRRQIPLGSIPSHLDVSSDGELLAVTVIDQDYPFLFIYSIQSFGSAVVEKKFQFTLSNMPGVKVLDLQWNPGVANMIGIVTSDGAAMACEFTANGPMINSIPANSQSLCLCWSPKGKRVVIGSKGGSIMQYMPDMKVVKAIPTPTLPMKSINVISIRWLSNTQYIVVYKDSQDQSGNSAVVVINVQQNQQPHFINYEDVCCGALTERPEHYFIHLPQWNIIVLGSGNALETAVLKQNGDSWVQWIIDDGNRAELPLTEDHSDVYNVGMAFDFSPQFPVPVGENRTIEPVPLLLMLSHAGVLCLFHSMNFVTCAPKLCIQPLHLPLHNFIDKPNETSQSAQVQSTAAVESTPARDKFEFSMPSFGTSQPSVTMDQSATSGFQVPQPIGQTSMASPLNIPFPQPAMGQPLFNFQSTTQSPQLNIPQLTPSVPKSIPLQFQNSLGGFQQSPQKMDHVQKPSIFTQVQSTVANMSVAAPIATPAPVTSFGFTTPMSINKDSNIGSSGFNIQQANTTVTPAKSLPSSTLVQPEPPSYTQSASGPTLVTPEKEAVPVDSEKPSKEALEKAKREKEKVIVDSLIKESKSVENEFNDFKKKIMKFDLTPGHESVLKSIPSKVADLEIFEKDLSETTSTQSSEVNVLRCSLVEVYGWVENIKAKDRQVKSQRYLDCLESQALDPIVKRHLRSIEQQMHFFESQVKQATASLDSLWANYKSKNTNTIDVPNLESIYEAIVNQAYILAVQKNIVNDLQTKMKQFLRNKKIVPQVIEYSSPSYNFNTSSSDLDILADKLLHTKINNKSPSKSYKETSYRYIVLANARKHLSSSKENILIQWHKSHKVINTKAAKPYSFSDEDEELYISPLSPVNIFEEVTPNKEVKSLPEVMQKPVTNKSPFTLSDKTSTAPTTHFSSLQSAYSIPSVSKPQSFPNTNLIVPSFPLIKESSKSTVPTTLSVSVFTTSSFSFSEGSKILGSDVQLTKIPPKTSSSSLGIMYEEVPMTIVTESNKTVSSSQFTSSPTSTIFGGSTHSTSLTSVCLSTSGSAFKLPTSSLAVASATSPPKSQAFAQFNFGNSSVSNNGNTTTKLETPLPASTTSTATSTKTGHQLLSNNPTMTSSNIFGISSSLSSPLSFGGSAFTFATTTAASTTLKKLTSTTDTVANSKSTLYTTPSVKTTASELQAITSPSEMTFDKARLQHTTTASPTTLSFSMTPSVLTSETQDVTSVSSLSQEQGSITSTSMVNTTATSSTMSTSSTKGIFSIPNTTVATTTTVSLFGSTSFSTTSFFSTSTTGNVFGGSSIFGTCTTTTSTVPSITTVSSVTTTPSLFGGTTSSISFGSPATIATPISLTTMTVSQQPGFSMSTPSTQTSIFGGTPATSTPVFGTPSITTVFGAPTTTSSSIFGGAPTTTSLFGTPTTPSTTNSLQPIFGVTPTTTTSLFGSPTTTATTSTPVFGAAQALGSTSFFSTPSSMGNAFMNQPQSSQPFGGTQQQTSSSFKTLFFQNSTPTTNVFGTSTFGQKVTTTATSIFGGSPTFVQSTGNIFGNATTPNKFATNSASIFGGSSFSSPTQQSTFSTGQSGSLFGSSNTFSNVGQANVSQSGFGSPSSFGSSGSSMFGRQATFGNSPTFGGSATFGSPKKVFGEATSKPTFGSPTPQSSTFENLAGQNTLTFGNLAQNQSGFGSSFGGASPTQHPTFPATTFGGSSFSSWR